MAGCNCYIYSKLGGWTTNKDQQFRFFSLIIIITVPSRYTWFPSVVAPRA